MDDIMIVSTKNVENSFEKEYCEISMKDLTRLAYFALSFELHDDDIGISEAGTYYNALKRFFEESNDEVSDLRNIYSCIKDDTIVTMLFIQNIGLILLKNNITDKESYDKYVRALEEFKKSIDGNDYQKHYR